MKQGTFERVVSNKEQWFLFCNFVKCIVVCFSTDTNMQAERLSLRRSEKKENSQRNIELKLNPESEREKKEGESERALHLRLWGYFASIGWFFCNIYHMRFVKSVEGNAQYRPWNWCFHVKSKKKIHPTKSFSLLIAALKTLLVLDLSYGLTHPCCTKCLF